jgi:hypothetical protein
MGLSSTYIFNLDKFSLEMLVEISPLRLGRDFYLGRLGIGDGGFVVGTIAKVMPAFSLIF